MYHNAEYHWMPTYTTANGESYTVDGLVLDECPVSYVTPKSAELVQIVARAEYAKVPLYGPDLSKWPIWAVDAINLIEREKIRENNARLEAEQQGQ